MGSGRPWTPKEDRAVLETCAPAPERREKLGKKINRKPEAIRKRFSRLRKAAEAAAKAKDAGD